MVVAIVVRTEHTKLDLFQATNMFKTGYCDKLFQNLPCKTMQFSKYYVIQIHSLSFCCKSFSN